MKKRMKVKMVFGDIYDIDNKVNDCLEEIDVDPEKISLHFYCNDGMHFCMISYYGYYF